MNKRGQFYIIMAVIIALAIYSLYLPQNKIQTVTLFEDFKDVAINFQSEAPKVINYALNIQDDPKDYIEPFSRDFLKQARETNPNVHLALVYSDGQRIYVKNFFDEATIAYPGCDIVVDPTCNEYQTIFGEEQSTVNSITLNVSGKNFEHDVPVKIRNFGEEFSSTIIPNPPANFIVLDIGGVFHNFDLSGAGPRLEFIMELENNPQDYIEVIQRNTNPYQVRF